MECQFFVFDVIVIVIVYAYNKTCEVDSSYLVVCIHRLSITHSELVVSFANLWYTTIALSRNTIELVIQHVIEHNMGVRACLLDKAR